MPVDGGDSYERGLCLGKGPRVGHDAYQGGKGNHHIHRA